jgi:SpoVK/Ycf46/Vps4 family AAA+-type ATPase
MFAPADVSNFTAIIQEVGASRVDKTPKIRLENVAQRIEPHTNLKDAALAHALPCLRKIVEDTRKHGMSVLFTGANGAGKTLAAEALAAELHRVLYRVDLKQLVTKYIGETEKNLGRVFDTAESGGAILFFDETDALFGKRSEVNDSHDRYLNLETNYLLQRMESHKGLVIFATKDRDALEKSLLSCFGYVVEFPCKDNLPRQSR